MIPEQITDAYLASILEWAARAISTRAPGHELLDDLDALARLFSVRDAWSRMSSKDQDLFASEVHEAAALNATDATDAPINFTVEGSCPPEAQKKILRELAESLQPPKLTPLPPHLQVKSKVEIDPRVEPRPWVATEGRTAEESLLQRWLEHRMGHRPLDAETAAKIKKGPRKSPRRFALFHHEKEGRTHMMEHPEGAWVLFHDVAEKQP